MERIFKKREEIKKGKRYWPITGRVVAESINVNRVNETRRRCRNGHEERKEERRSEMTIN